MNTQSSSIWIDIIDNWLYSPEKKKLTDRESNPKTVKFYSAWSDAFNCADTKWIVKASTEDFLPN